MENLPDAQGFLFTVHRGHNQRDAGVPGNVIKAHLPFRHMMARPFRGDDQDELIGLLAGGHHLLHQPAGLFPVHGDAAAPVEEPAEGIIEQLGLAHITDIGPQEEDRAQEQNKIPIGCVRRTDQDEFWDIGQHTIHTPA